MLKKSGKRKKAASYRNKRKKWAHSFVSFIVFMMMCSQTISVSANEHGAAAESKVQSEAASIQPAIEMEKNRPHPEVIPFNEEQDNNGKNSSSEILTLFTNDTTLKNVSTYDYYMYVPFMEYGDHHYLSLTFSHSQLLRQNHSTLTVMVDDVSIWSEPLTTEHAARANVKIPLSKAKLTTGFHKISFAFYGSMTEDFCADDRNPANWLTLHKESYLLLDTKGTIPANNILQHFPYPFIQEQSKQTVQGVIVVPDDPASTIIEAAVNLSHYLLSKTDGQTPIDVLTESEFEALKQKDQHIIALGKASDWQYTLKNVMTGLTDDIEPEKLTIKSMLLPDSTKLLMMVTAASDETIKEKIVVLTNESFVRQLSGNTLTISKLPALFKEKQTGVLDFATIGTGDMTLTANTSTSDTIFYSIPSHWKIKGDLTLHLSLKVSPLLKQEGKDDTGLTIMVNHIPYTIPIDKLIHQADDYILYDIKIPLEAVEKTKSLTLSFSSNLVNNETNCMKMDDSAKWVFIDKGSSIDIPYEIPASESFRYWPSVLVMGDDIEKTAFILPSHVNRETLTELAYLVNHIGTDLPPIKQFKIVKGNEVTDSLLQTHNLVLFGTADEFNNMPFLKKILNPFDLAPRGILEETMAYAAFLQPSYWNEQRSMLFFLRLHEESIAEKKPAYYSVNMLHFLKANHEEIHVVAVNKSGEIIAEAVKEQSASNSNEEGSIADLFEKSKWLLYVLVGLFIATAVLFGSIVWKERKKRKNKEE